MEVVVVGAGYVGLVAAAGLASIGHRVTCVDVDAAKVEAINAARPLLYEPGLEPLIASALAQQTFRATTDLQVAASADLVFICVGTPPGPDGAVDLTALRGVANALGEVLRTPRAYRVVVVKSTVVPGTTEEVVGPAIWRASGWSAREVGLVSNPEFTREGRAVRDFLEPDRIVIGGIDEKSTAFVSDAYRPLGAPVFSTAPRTAEMIKYSSNALLAAMISFSNEIAGICEATPGVDVEDVMDGLHLDERLTPVLSGGARVTPGILAYLRAGCGYGGSCLPKDVIALVQYARAAGAPAHLLEAVARVNASRPRAVVRLAEAALGRLAGRTLAVLGLSFKADTDDLRSSPSLAVIDQLLAAGANIQAYDPAGGTGARLRWRDEPRVAICASAAAAVSGADAALVLTAWPEFRALDWGELRSAMAQPVVVDGRRALDGRQLEATGYQYLCIGRHQPAAVAV